MPVCMGYIDIGIRKDCSIAIRVLPRIRDGGRNRLIKGEMDYRTPNIRRIRKLHELDNNPQTMRGFCLRNRLNIDFESCLVLCQ